MTQIDELHGRISRALDQIAQRVEGYAPPESAGEDPEAAARLAELEAAMSAAQEDAKAAQIEANVAREAAAAEAEKTRQLEDEVAQLTDQLAAAKEAAEMAVSAVPEPEPEAEPVAEVEEPAAPAVDSGELDALREELEDEKMANAQLQERLRVLTARQEEAPVVADTGGDSDQRAAMEQLDTDLQRLRAANTQLEETIVALREANAQGVGDPHLINKAMLAELENLRRARATDMAETNAVLAAMEPLLADAAEESA